MMNLEIRWSGKELELVAVDDKGKPLPPMTGPDGKDSQTDPENLRRRSLLGITVDKKAVTLQLSRMPPSEPVDGQEVVDVDAIKQAADGLAFIAEMVETPGWRGKFNQALRAYEHAVKQFSRGRKGK